MGGVSFRESNIIAASNVPAKGTISHISDSVKRHLPIEYAADLTPVVAGKEAGASWNARGMAETG
jgi:hypothetical protein